MAAPKHRDRNSRNDRAIAVALWAVFGACLGLAAGVWVSSPPLLAAIGAVLGSAYGIFVTREKAPIDEE